MPGGDSFLSGATARFRSVEEGMPRDRFLSETYNRRDNG